MISDVLADAVAKMDRYVTDSATAECYADPEIRAEVAHARAVMDALRRRLDTPPTSTEPTARITSIREQERRELKHAWTVPYLVTFQPRWCGVGIRSLSVGLAPHQQGTMVDAVDALRCLAYNGARDISFMMVTHFDRCVLYARLLERIEGALGGDLLVAATYADNRDLVRYRARRLLKEMGLQVYACVDRDRVMLRVSTILEMVSSTFDTRAFGATHRAFNATCQDVIDDALARLHEMNKLGFPSFVLAHKSSTAEDQSCDQEKV